MFAIALSQKKGSRRERRGAEIAKKFTRQSRGLVHTKTQRHKERAPSRGVVHHLCGFVALCEKYLEGR